MKASLKKKILRANIVSITSALRTLNKRLGINIDKLNELDKEK